MLTLSNIETWYGEVQALFGVDLELGEGEALALMGLNGMGKSTTIRSICGMTPAGKGTVSFQGNDITRRASYRIARAGIGLVPEGRRCFPNLTVRENLVASARPGPWDEKRVHALFPRLEERASQMSNTLSGGEQQMLAVGRALMTNPKLLILDEATEGLAPVIRQEIWSAIRQLKQEGLSMIIVDKTLKELLPVADRVTIMSRGESVWHGTPATLDDATQERYLHV